MVQPTCFPPEQDRERVQGDALPVCALEDRDRCADLTLEGARPLADPGSREDELARDREIIFYCACPDHASAARAAARCEEKGFEDVKVIDGGHDA